MNALYIFYIYIVILCVMVNYLKPCFPFGFHKYMVGAQKQQHISVHTLSFTHNRRKMCRYTQACIYA